MTERCRGPLLALVVAALTTGGAACADSESLEQAWQLALKQDPALAAVNEEVEASRAAERAARGARLPSFALAANYLQLDQAPSLTIATPTLAFRSPPVFRDDATLTGSAELRLPLYAGGSIAAGIRAAASERRAAEAQQASAVADLKLEVARLYVEVLRTRSQRDVAAAQVAALQAHVNDVSVMVENGAVNRSDLLASRVALANAEQQRLRAVSAAAQARSSYNRRLGLALEREPELLPAIGPATASLAGNLPQLQQQAVGSRPELTVLGAKAAALHEQARAVSGRRLPQVGLKAGYSHLETTVLDREDFSLLGVGFTWQVFDGGQLRQQATALRRASRAAELRRDDYQQGVLLEVQQAYLARQESQARLTASREAMLEAEENLRMSRELYGAELIANTQVLEAIALQLSAAANARDAELDAALAEYRLLHATGEL